MKVCCFLRTAGFVLYLALALPHSYGTYVGGCWPTFGDRTA